jgi:hypothetical protein
MQPTEGEDPEAHWSSRSPKLVQVLQLERYEDSLDALELPDETEARRAGQMSFAVEPLRYVYEATTASASVALNTARLSQPFDFSIPQVRDGAPTLVPVDIAATALLLLGLHPVPVRDLRGKAGRNGKHRYRLIEARPNGDDKALHLLILRDVDESITGGRLRRNGCGRLAESGPRGGGRRDGCSRHRSFARPAFLCRRVDQRPPGDLHGRHRRERRVAGTHSTSTKRQALRRGRRGRARTARAEEGRK